MDERIISASIQADDEFQDNQLRPRSFSDYIGQTKLKENLHIFIEAAKERGDALDHVLLYGPPGLGKTTLSQIIAAELGVNLRATSGPAIERPGDLAAILTNLAPYDVSPVAAVNRCLRIERDHSGRHRQMIGAHEVFVLQLAHGLLREQLVAQVGFHGQLPDVVEQHWCS